jgi:ATP-dependent exoDNAse (exonuclease V) alpha subunit
MPDRNSVVVVDEVGLVGTRQMLDLLRLQQRTGAQIAMVGDPKQCQSIEARPDAPVRLSYGYAMTVDTAQGSTASEHIHALPAGSHALHGFKAYTAASRHERTTWIVVDEASERRHLASRFQNSASAFSVTSFTALRKASRTIMGRRGRFMVKPKARRS